MSRVYDALQQCIPDQLRPDVRQENNTHALFSEHFTESVWDPDAAPVVQPSLSSDDKLPALFETYSFASEQFRLLATRLQQLQKSRAFKSVVLTSSVEGEGKSLSALNLAVSLAQGEQQKVLLVDADLRKPGLSRPLNVSGRAGIREWHRTNCPVAELICRVASLKVWVLPAGQAKVDALEVLNSARLPDLLSSLNAVFDWVLIDSPPLLPLADAEIISRICDGTIIVVRRDKSPKSALQQALERVAPSKMVGFLLNEFPSSGNYGYATSTIEDHHISPGLKEQVQGL
jgi:capsular exopolysaccharide synthesis family protein